MDMLLSVLRGNSPWAEKYLACLEGRLDGPSTCTILTHCDHDWHSNPTIIPDCCAAISGALPGSV